MEVNKLALRTFSLPFTPTLLVLSAGHCAQDQSTLKLEIADSIYN